MVRQRSAKPLFIGSIPIAASTHSIPRGSCIWAFEESYSWTVCERFAVLEEDDVSPHYAFDYETFLRHTPKI